MSWRRRWARWRCAGFPPVAAEDVPPIGMPLAGCLAATVFTTPEPGAAHAFGKGSVVAEARHGDVRRTILDPGAEPAAGGVARWAIAAAHGEVGFSIRPDGSAAAPFPPSSGQPPFRHPSLGATAKGPVSWRAR